MSDFNIFPLTVLGGEGAGSGEDVNTATLP